MNTFDRFYHEPSVEAPTPVRRRQNGFQLGHVGGELDGNIRGHSDSNFNAQARISAVASEDDEGLPSFDTSVSPSSSTSVPEDPHRRNTASRHRRPRSLTSSSSFSSPQHGRSKRGNSTRNVTAAERIRQRRRRGDTPAIAEVADPGQRGEHRETASRHRILSEMLSPAQLNNPSYSYGQRNHHREAHQSPQPQVPKRTLKDELPAASPTPSRTEPSRQQGHSQHHRLVLSVTPPGSTTASSDDDGRGVDVARSPSLMKHALKVLSLEKELLTRRQRHQADNDSRTAPSNDEDREIGNDAAPSISSHTRARKNTRKNAAPMPAGNGTSSETERRKGPPTDGGGYVANRPPSSTHVALEVRDLVNQVRDAHSINLKLEEEVAHHKSVADSARVELQQCIQQQNSASSELKRVRASLAAALSDRDTVEAQLMDMVSRNKELLNTLSQRERHEADLDSLKKKLRNVEKENARLRAAKDDSEDAAAALEEECRKQLEKAFRESARLSEEVANLREANQLSSQQERAQVQAITDELAEAKRVTLSLEAELEHERSQSALQGSIRALTGAESADRRTNLLHAEAEGRVALMAAHGSALLSTTEHLTYLLQQSSASQQRLSATVRSLEEELRQATSLHEQRIQLAYSRAEAAETSMREHARSLSLAMEEVERMQTVILDLEKQRSTVLPWMHSTVDAVNNMWSELVDPFFEILVEESAQRCKLHSTCQSTERAMQQETLASNILSFTTAAKHSVFSVRGVVDGGSEARTLGDPSVVDFTRTHILAEEASEWLLLKDVLSGVVIPAEARLAAERTQHGDALANLEDAFKVEREAWLAEKQAAHEKDSQSTSRHTRLVNTLGQARNKAERHSLEAAERANRFQVVHGYLFGMLDAQIAFTAELVDVLLSESRDREARLTLQREDDAVADVSMRLSAAFEGQLAAVEEEAACERDELLNQIADWEKQLAATKSTMQAALSQAHAMHEAQILALKEQAAQAAAESDSRHSQEVNALKSRLLAQAADMESLKVTHASELRNQLDTHRVALYELEDTHRAEKQRLQETLHNESLNLKTVEHSLGSVHGDVAAKFDLYALQVRHDIVSFEAELRREMANKFDELMREGYAVISAHRKLLGDEERARQAIELNLRECNVERDALRATLHRVRGDHEATLQAAETLEAEVIDLRGVVAQLETQLHKIEEVRPSQEVRNQHPTNTNYHFGTTSRQPVPAPTHTREVDITEFGAADVFVGSPPTPQAARELLAHSLIHTPHSSFVTNNHHTAPLAKASATAHGFGTHGKMIESGDYDDVVSIREANRELRKQLRFCVDRLYELEGSVGVLQGRRRERLELLYGLPFFSSGESGGDEMSNAKATSVAVLTPTNNVVGVPRHHTNEDAAVSEEVRMALRSFSVTPNISKQQPMTPTKGSFSSPTPPSPSHLSPVKHNGSPTSRVLLHASQLASENYRVTLAEERELLRKLEQENDLLRRKLEVAEAKAMWLEDTLRQFKGDVLSPLQKDLVEKSRQLSEVQATATANSSVLQEQQREIVLLREQQASSDGTIDQLVEEAASERAAHEKTRKLLGRFQKQAALKSGPCAGCEQLKAALAVADMVAEQKHHDPQPNNHRAPARTASTSYSSTQTSPPRTSRQLPTSKEQQRTKNKKVQVETLSESMMVCAVCAQRRDQQQQQRSSPKGSTQVVAVGSPLRTPTRDRRDGSPSQLTRNVQATNAATRDGSPTNTSSITRNKSNAMPAVPLLLLKQSATPKPTVHQRGARNDVPIAPLLQHTTTTTSRNRKTSPFSSSPGPRRLELSQGVASASAGPSHHPRTFASSPRRGPSFSSSPSRPLPLERKSSNVGASELGDNGVVSPVQIPDGWVELADDVLALPRRRSEGVGSAQDVGQEASLNIASSGPGSPQHPQQQQLWPMMKRDSHDSEYDRAAAELEDLSTRIQSALNERGRTATSPPPRTKGTNGEGDEEGDSGSTNGDEVEVGTTVVSISVSRSGTPLHRQDPPRADFNDQRRQASRGDHLRRVASPFAQVRPFVMPPPRRATLHSPPRTRRNSSATVASEVGVADSFSAPVPFPVGVASSSSPRSIHFPNDNPQQWRQPNRAATAPASRGWEVGDDAVSSSGEIALTSEVVELASRLFQRFPTASSPNEPSIGDLQTRSLDADQLLAPASIIPRRSQSASRVFPASVRNASSSSSPLGDRGSPILVVSSRTLLPNPLHRYPLSDNRQYPAEFLKSVYHHYEQ